MNVFGLLRRLSVKLSDFFNRSKFQKKKKIQRSVRANINVLVLNTIDII